MPIECQFQAQSAGLPLPSSNSRGGFLPSLLAPSSRCGRRPPFSTLPQKTLVSSSNQPPRCVSATTHEYALPFFTLVLASSRQALSLSEVTLTCVTLLLQRCVRKTFGYSRAAAQVAPTAALKCLLPGVRFFIPLHCLKRHYYEKSPSLKIRKTGNPPLVDKTTPDVSHSHIRICQDRLGACRYPPSVAISVLFSCDD